MAQDILDQLQDKFDFMAYERVRRSGVTNMWDIETVSALSGLEKQTVRGVMKNYDALAKKYLKYCV